MYPPRTLLATGEAEAKRIEAQGRADAVAIEAKAQSVANKVIAESLTPSLLQMQQIEVQGKFNEAFGFRTDYQILPTKKMKKIFKMTKTTKKVRTF